MLPLCVFCANKIWSIFGDAGLPADQQKAIMFGEGGSSAQPTGDGLDCAACFGAFATLDGYADAVIDAVRSSPFRDCASLALSVSVPRALSFSFAAAALHRATKCGPAAASALRIDAAAVVPSVAVGALRDAIIAEVTARVSRVLYDADTSAVGPSTEPNLTGSTHAKRPRGGANGGSVRFYRRGKVDDDDTIVADCDVNVCALLPLPESEQGPSEKNPAASSRGGEHVVVVAIPARRAVAAEATSAARRTGSAFAAAVASLPAELHSNKSTLPFSWQLIARDILPALEKDSGAVGTAGSKTLRGVAAVDVWRSSAFLVGRYRKMMRDVPQSPWFLDNGQRLGRLSLQEVIAAEALPTFFDESALRPSDEPSDRNGKPKAATEDAIFGGRRYKFHSAGREDVDVRMLGVGRPFVIELLSPHRVLSVTGADLASIEDRINNHSDDVEVEDLCVVTDRNIMQLLHRMSEEKRKRYRCVCFSSRPLLNDEDPLLTAVNALTQPFDIVQQTPLRVLHRRSQMARPKTMFGIQIRRVNSHWMVVDLDTQAGVYVKEFCHGDMGRTSPSLGDLLQSVCDIIQLDVLGVDAGREVAAELEALVRVRSSATTSGDDTAARN